ncbi:MAG: hypothetical protein FWB79_04025 [Treponema sp.]|nr:hypothetical protein [Treponema sp.]
MAKRFFGTGIPVMLLVFGISVVGCEMPDHDDSRLVTDVRATLMKGTAPNQDSVHITWNRTSGATRYEIAYRTDMDSLDTRRPVNAQVTITTFSHTGFIRNQGPLTYFVRAHGSTTNADGVRTPWTGPWAMSLLVEVRE